MCERGNNPAGADGREILVKMQRILAAAQLSRYPAPTQHLCCGEPKQGFLQERDLQRHDCSHIPEFPPLIPGLCHAEGGNGSILWCLTHSF
jgi:hypothetical protein